MAENIKNLDELKNIIEYEGEVKIKIKVTTNSKNNSIEFLSDIIKIKIKQRPVEGKANKAIIEFLSDEIKIPKSKISIFSGEKSSLKMLKILR